MVGFHNASAYTQAKERFKMSLECNDLKLLAEYARGSDASLTFMQYALTAWSITLAPYAS